MRDHASLAQLLISKGVITENEYLAALADGILDAAILILYEGRFRPDQPPYEPWISHQRGKIERGLAALEVSPPPIDRKSHCRLLRPGYFSAPSRLRRV